MMFDRQRLHGVLAVMQKEFQVETAHVAAGVAAARRIQPHRGERVGEAAIDAFDGIQRKLALRHSCIGKVSQRRIALQIGKDDRCPDLREDALEQRGIGECPNFQARNGAADGQCANP